MAAKKKAAKKVAKKATKKVAKKASKKKKQGLYHCKSSDITALYGRPRKLGLLFYL